MAHDFDELEPTPWEADIEEQRRKARVVMIPDRLIVWLWRKLCELFGI